MTGFENFGKRNVEDDAKMECGVCWHVYDPAEGDPEAGIAPGTAFEDIPDNWSCPDCGATKADFHLIHD